MRFAAGAILIVVVAQRVTHVVAITGISPGYSKGKIDRSGHFTGNQIFTIEQAGACNITLAERHLRQAIVLFPQTNLKIERLILVALIAAEILVAAVFAGADVGITNRPFQPRKEHDRRGVKTVLVVIAVVDAEFPFPAKARVGHLHQAGAAKIGL